MRIALAIVMTITQLAGPWLCCCGPERALAAVPTQHLGGCPHCQHEPPPNDHERKPPCGPDRCPIGGMQAVFVPADKPESVYAADLLVRLVATLPEPVGVVSESVQSVAGLRDVPHLTAADRLFAHHVLRC
jgi:hypothetical protein